MNWWLFIIPLTSAFSCWLVIRILFVLLFRPYSPTSFLGFRIQGALPASQAQLASKAGKLAAVEFGSMKILEEKVSDPSHLQKIMPVIEEHLDDFLRNKLKKEMPVVGMLIGEKTITSLKTVFLKELEELFPKIIGGFVSNIADDLNIEAMVSKKISAIQPREIYLAFRKDYGRKMRIIEAAAACVGLLTGLVTLLIIFLTS